MRYDRALADLLLHARPFVNAWDNVLSQVLAVALLMTLVSGSMLKQQMLSADRTGDTYDDTAFAVLMVVTNGGVLLLSIGSFFGGNKWFQTQWDRRRRSAGHANSSTSRAVGDARKQNNKGGGDIEMQAMASEESI